MKACPACASENADDAASAPRAELLWHSPCATSSAPYASSSRPARCWIASR